MLKKSETVGTNYSYGSTNVEEDDDDYIEDEFCKDDEEIEFLSGNYPKKYVKVLERIMNTQKTGTFEPNIKSFTDAAGAGQISSTAGEILSMMTISMTDEQMGLLEQKLGEHFDNIDDSMFKKGSKKSKLIIVDVAFFFNTAHPVSRHHPFVRDRAVKLFASQSAFFVHCH